MTRVALRIHVSPFSSTINGYFAKKRQEMPLPWVSLSNFEDEGPCLVLTKCMMEQRFDIHCCTNREMQLQGENTKIFFPDNWVVIIGTSFCN